MTSQQPDLTNDNEHDAIGNALAKPAPRRTTVQQGALIGAGLFGLAGLRSGADAQGKKEDEKNGGDSGNQAAQDGADAEHRGRRRGGRRGPTGPTGPSGPSGGPTGPTGNTGPVGPRGAAAGATVTMESASVQLGSQAGDTTPVTVSCTSNRVMTGAYGSCNNEPSREVTSMEPNGSTQVVIRFARRSTVSNPTQVTAHAVCIQ